ncbi:riboflavin aldehyde-forming enzyme [Gymnopus androsaceus JB14]|uniref:Riboflavin aldehyde-forming enzyme n=1 Tax=Gymnopus androsaceus JB14 TaxID=1447944 RepID=A0A6A4IAF2_9AGAR|nr:riboflavin aldehyde-forming enzyme [Gymnopus androsaceus JB14]
MFRVALLFTLITMILFVSSAPVELEKRVTHTGRGTWFEPGLGNCGKVNSASDPIIAIPKSLYDANGGSNCNQWIHITDTATGHVAYGLTTDSCPSCGSGDLDMSPAVFQDFASLGVGVLSISWYFLPMGQSPP